MRPAMSFGQVVAIFFSLSNVAAAAWPGFLPQMDALVARQDDEETTAVATETAAAEDSTITDGPSTGNLNTATFDSDDTATDDEDSDATATTFDVLSPVGGVDMIEPTTTTLILYKLGDYVTLSWNYTDLLATPTAVNVIAVDTSASQTHTLTQNMTFEIPAEYTWDTESYQSENAISKGLRVAQYTLIIYDSEGDPTDTAEAGYLSPYNSLQFGIYTAQPYEDLGSWVCTVCNSAPGALAASAAGFAVTLAFGAGVALTLV